MRQVYSSGCLAYPAFLIGNGDDLCGHLLSP